MKYVKTMVACQQPTAHRSFHNPHTLEAETTPPAIVQTEGANFLVLWA
ncbi:MAG: hypothetical protein KME16_17305 [Scytolyngbya sp. HA4215-MV1]|jgi:hypothetical protein|nr:hypothetical protein [Scytolyngbya sp. HA4215-MV1]